MSQGSLFSSRSRCRSLNYLLKCGASAFPTKGTLSTGRFLQPLTHPTWRSGNHSRGGGACPTPGLRPLCPVGWPAAPTLRPGPGQQPDAGAVEVGPGMVLVRAKREDRRQVPPWLRQVALGRWPWASLLTPASVRLVHNRQFPVPSPPCGFSPERLEAPSCSEHCSPALSPLHRGGWALLSLRAPAALCKAGCSASWDWRC